MLNESYLQGYRQNLDLIKELIETEDRFGFVSGGHLLEYRFDEGELYSVNSSNKLDRYIGPIAFILSHPLFITKKNIRLSQNAVVILESIDKKYHGGLLRMNHQSHEVILYSKNPHDGKITLSNALSIPFYGVLLELKDGFYDLDKLIEQKGALIKWENY